MVRPVHRVSQDAVTAMIFRRLRLAGLASALFLSWHLPAAAQRDFFSDDRDSKQQSNVPGEFDYYALVMSWSPTHCSSTAGYDDDQQCNRNDGRRYAFILHGLWPQHERGWPQNCRTRRKPFVPQPLIDSMMDIMPSQKLVIHEYRKHGTCSGLDPAGYYALSRKLFESIEVPERYSNPFEVQQVAPEKLRREFVAANPGLQPDMIAISCDGTKLREIRICFSKEGEPISCGPNENPRKLCSAREMFVPPVRSMKMQSNTPGVRRIDPGDYLPGPR
jgi:ribonuclease T2